MVVSCMLLLTGCFGSAESAGSSTPLPSPTGTWTEPATDAAEGPQTPAPVPTETAAVDAPVEFSTGVTVAIDKVSAISVTATTPGEISGSAVSVTVRVTNDSNAPVNLDSAVVNLTAEDGAYGVGTTAGDPQPFVGDIAPGASATGTYVFMLEPAAGRSVNVIVNYGAGEPLAVFTGKTS
ncbi:MAG: hypothetical protein ABWY03_02640 [Microbacterium sp.]